MECIDQIQELRACVPAFSTCLLHRLRGLATAFVRGLDANEAQT